MFLLNDLVIGVHNVQNGTSQVALQAVKQELDKIKKAADKLSYNTDKISIQNIVSSTCDGASTQKSLTAFLKSNLGKKKGILLQTYVARIWESIFALLR